MQTLCSLTKALKYRTQKFLGWTQYFGEGTHDHWLFFPLGAPYRTAVLPWCLIYAPERNCKHVHRRRGVIEVIYVWIVFFWMFFNMYKETDHVIDPIHSSAETKHLHVAVVSPFLNWSPPVAVDLYCWLFPRHLFNCGIEVFKMTWSCSTVSQKASDCSGDDRGVSMGLCLCVHVVLWSIDCSWLITICLVSIHTQSEQKPPHCDLCAPLRGGCHDNWPFSLWSCGF